MHYASVSIIFVRHFNLFDPFSEIFFQRKYKYIKFYYNKNDISLIN